MTPNQVWVINRNQLLTINMNVKNHCSRSVTATVSLELPLSSLVKSIVGSWISWASGSSSSSSASSSDRPVQYIHRPTYRRRWIEWHAK